MTITVSCPSCGTSFPVDPAKVPPGGVRAQCSSCPEIFEVDRPSVATAEAPLPRESTVETVETAAPLEPETVDLPTIEGSFEGAESTVAGDGPIAAGTGVVETEDFAAVDMSFDPGQLDTGGGSVEVEEPAAAPELSEAPDLPQAESAPIAPPAEEAPVGEAPVAPSGGPAESSGRIRFGRRSSEDRAKSLARSMVSDLIAYNSEKHRQALAAGNLQEVFGEEIEKSLKEYEEQVEPDVMAKGTFFNDALNSILAEGQSIFSLDQ